MNNLRFAGNTFDSVGKICIYFLLKYFFPKSKPDGLRVQKQTCHQYLTILLYFLCYINENLKYDNNDSDNTCFSHDWIRVLHWLHWHSWHLEQWFLLPLPQWQQWECLLLRNLLPQVLLYQEWPSDGVWTSVTWREQCHHHHCSDGGSVILNPSGHHHLLYLLSSVSKLWQVKHILQTA